MNLWPSTSSEKSTIMNARQILSNASHEDYNTEEINKNINPLDDLNLTNIVNHYKLISTSSANNVTQDGQVENNTNQITLNEQIGIDEASNKCNEVETKISLIKELNETLMNTHKLSNNTAVNSVQECSKVRKTNELMKEDQNYLFQVNGPDLKSFAYDNELCKGLDTTKGHKILRPKFQKTNISGEVITIPELNKDLMEQFNSFFDEYENSTQNESSDSGISEDLLFDYDKLEKIFLHEDTNKTDSALDDVFDIIAKNDEIKVLQQDSGIKLYTDAIPSLTNHYTRSLQKDQIQFTTTENVDSVDCLVDAFVKNIDMNSEYSENIDRDSDKKYIENIAKDLIAVKDFPKILIPKLNKNISMDKELLELAGVNREVENVSNVDFNDDLSSKQLYSKTLDTKLMKGPFTILVNSDGEETIIYTTDDEVANTLDANIVDIGDTRADEVLDTESSIDKTNLNNTADDDNGVIFYKTASSFEKQLEINLCEDKLTTEKNNNHSYSTNIGIKPDTFRNDYKIPECFLSNDDFTTNKKAEEVDIIEKPNLEKIISTCTETVLNILQNQTPLLNMEKIIRNKPQINDETALNTRELDPLKQNLKVQSVTNNLLRDLQDTKTKENLKTNHLAAQIFTTNYDFKVLNPNDGLKGNKYKSLRTINIPSVQKNKKLYAKRLVRSDAEKCNFTKGPTLYEKSIVLPQILERLSARKARFDEMKNFKRRLILDDGPMNVNNIDQNCTNDATMATNLKMSITNIRNLNRPSTSRHFDVTSIFNNKQLNATKTSADFRTEIATDDNIISCNDLAEKSNIYKLDFNIGNALRNISANNVAGTETSGDKSLGDISKSMEDKEVELNPDLLLEDCNRERYLEWKKRQWLHKFVE